MRNWLLIAGCLVAAFIGGAVSNWALSAQVAAAQEKSGAGAAPELTVSALRVTVAAAGHPGNPGLEEKSQS